MHWNVPAALSPREADLGQKRTPPTVCTHTPHHPQGNWFVDIVLTAEGNCRTNCTDLQGVLGCNACVRRRGAVVFFYLELAVVDEVCTGTYRQLSYPKKLISGKEDAANSSHAYTITESRIIDLASDCTRKLPENCTDHHEVLVCNGCGGSTGLWSRMSAS